MRYVQPYGSTDVDASYVNGNPAIGLQGSIPPAEMVEQRMREIVNHIGASDLLTDPYDLKQFMKATRSQRVNFAADIGTVNALHVICVPAVTELLAGFPLRVLVGYTNTGSANIRVNGIGPITILRANGSSLDDGDLVAGEVVELVYDGSYFQIANFLGYTAAVENNYYYNFDIPYAVDTSGTPNVLTAAFNPAITALTAGLVVEVKVANNNTAACTITVNALPSVAIKSGDLQNLVADQIVAGQVAVLVYDGMQFQLINAAKPRQVTSSGVIVAKRQIYQDPDYHILTSPFWAECFRTSYVPVTAGNKIRVQIAGTGNVDWDRDLNYAHDYNWQDYLECMGIHITSTSMTDNNGYTAAGVNFLCSYSSDGGRTWRAPADPVFDLLTLPEQFGTSANFPMALGTFAANIGWAGDFPVYFKIRNFHYNFAILGEMTVPSGPPTSIIFRISIRSLRQATSMLHGGSVIDITEYTP